MKSTVHPFERAGLGKAPFRVIGVTEERGPITLEDGSQAGAPGQPMGSCNYCGRGIALVFRIAGADGAEFSVGSDCVLKTHDNGLIDETKNLRRAMSATKRNKKRAEKQKARLAAIADRAEQFLNEHEGLRDALIQDHAILRDLNKALLTFGLLSEKQVDLAFTLARRIQNHKEQNEARMALLSNASPWESGRIRLEGTVVCTKKVEAFPSGRSISTIKMIVELTDGKRCWGTVPRGLLDFSDWDQLKGQRVEFVATVQPSPSDPHFAFFKRPTAGKILEGGK